MTAAMPVPTTISPEAQTILAEAALRPSVADPAPDDDQGWYEHTAFTRLTDPAIVFALALATTGAVPAEGAPVAERRVVDDAVYYVATPSDQSDDDPRTMFAIHGGGFAAGGGESAKVSTELLAANYGVRVWGMDYRQLPDHPFPAGLEDCMTVYRQLISEVDPSAVVIGGQSGGANLTAAVLLRARDEQLPLPSAAYLLSPPVDLTGAGDSNTTNAFAVIPGGIRNMALRYANGQDLSNPYISPLFGEYSSEFPPTILTAGTRDFLLSDTVRMHRKLLAAGVRAELHVWEGAPHGLFMGRAPEDREQVAEVRRFLNSAWSDAGYPG